MDTSKFNQTPTQKYQQPTTVIEAIQQLQELAKLRIKVTNPNKPVKKQDVKFVLEFTIPIEPTSEDFTTQMVLIATKISTLGVDNINIKLDTIPDFIKV